MTTPALEAAYKDLRHEYGAMRRKHQEHSIDGEQSSDFERLAALVEEFGEVGECLTYDKMFRDRLRDELIQLANVAITWASIL
jgi:NTP pyrophosphatase (non-canonical NTP hydrolase)